MVKIYRTGSDELLDWICGTEPFSFSIYAQLWNTISYAAIKIQELFPRIASGTDRREQKRSGNFSNRMENIICGFISAERPLESWLTASQSLLQWHKTTYTWGPSNPVPALSAQSGARHSILNFPWSLTSSSKPVCQSLFIFLESAGGFC